jgi:hypothetical protein
MHRIRQDDMNRILFFVLLSIYWPCHLTAQRADTVRSDPAGAERWAITARPSLSIGLTDGPLALVFERIVDAIELEDGSIAVADQLAYEIRFFDSTGRHLASHGRRGDGPSEFSSVVQLLPCLSTTGGVHILDGGAGQLLEYSAGGFGTAIPARIDGMARTPGRIICGPRGRLVALSRPHAISSSAGVYRPSMHVAIVNESLGLVAEIGPFPGQERERFATSDGPRLLGRNTVIAANRDHIFVGNNDAPSISAYDYTGRLVRVIEWSTPRRVISSAMKDSLLAGLKRAAPPERWPDVERYWRGLEYPPELPFYRRALSDSYGRLWVEEYPAPGSLFSRWLVFDPDLLLRARLVVPSAFTPYQISREWMLGVHTDDEGVQRVQKYRYGVPSP